MARDLSSPLASTFGGNKKKSKKKSRNVEVDGGGSTARKKTISRKSGSQKSITVSPDGTKKTVLKVNKKGRVKQKDTDIDIANNKVTTTKSKGGKTVSTKTVKGLTPKQANMLEASPGTVSSLAKRNIRKAKNFKSTEQKAKEKLKRKNERESNISPEKARRQSERSGRKQDRRAKRIKRGPSQQRLEKRADRKKKGAGCSVERNKKNCAMPKARQKNK